MIFLHTMCNTKIISSPKHYMSIFSMQKQTTEKKNCRKFIFLCFKAFFAVFHKSKIKNNFISGWRERGKLSFCERMYQLVYYITLGG